MEAYCVKCHSKKEMKDATVIIMKNKNQPLKVSAPPAGPSCSGLGKTSRI